MKIVVIQRDGQDGVYFPVTSTSCLFGQSDNCDIRIQLPNVSPEHSRLDVNTDRDEVSSAYLIINPHDNDVIF